MSSNHQNELHISMHGKGGVGKSVISILNGQYLRMLNPQTTVVDTDPINPTTKSFASLNPQYIVFDKVDSNNNAVFDYEKMSEFLETLLQVDFPVQIDVGTSNYPGMKKFLLDEEAFFESLHETGKEIFIHLPIVGNRDMASCLHEMRELITAFDEKFPFLKYILWENCSRGEVVGLNEEPYRNTDAFKAIEHRIAATVILRYSHAELSDMNKILSDCMIFSDVETTTNPKYKTLERSRLNKLKQRLFVQLDNIYEELSVANKGNNFRQHEQQPVQQATSFVVAQTHEQAESIPEQAAGAGQPTPTFITEEQAEN